MNARGDDGAMNARGLPGLVFSGPSLPAAAVAAAGFAWRPPVRQGDVTEALAWRPAAIGIVDGLFEAVPTVWHKEILAALAQGVRVYGAASIGALRAAELDVFGMVGVGEIYAAYRDGTLADDDEVALLHGPPELGFVAVTEAMVDLRASVAAWIAAGLVAAEAGGSFLTACKAMFYKDRAPDRVAALGVAMLGADFPAWPRIDRKRLDAEALLRQMRSGGDPAWSG